MTPLNPQDLREAFGTFPTGVTVVTTRDKDGTPLGFTANSFTSVSLDPPLLLVCPGRRMTSFDAFSTCTHFAVNILAEGQEDVSNTFAGYKGDRFAQVNWRPDIHGVPLLDGCAAWFSCSTHEVVPAGDHVILLGQVAALEKTRRPGLGFVRGGYFSLGLERAASTGPDSQTPYFAGAILEKNGAILLEETAEGLRPPQVRITSRDRARTALLEHFAEQGLSMRLEQAFAIFDMPDGAHFTYFRATAETSEVGGLGRFVPLSELDTAEFISQAHRTMLLRFAAEHKTRHFGLYVGDAETGNLHKSDRGER